MRNLSLRQLRALAAIGRTHRIAAAADELGLTGPAVTLQLQQMERETGLTLFDRTPQGLRATEAGLVMLEAAAQVSAALSACEEKLTALKGLEGGRITVGAVSTAKYFTPSMIVAFSRLHPAVSLQLRVGNRNEILDLIRDFQLDVIVMGRPPADVPVESAEIGTHPLLMVAAPDHPLAYRRGLTREALRGQTFLIREEGSGTRISMEIYLSGLPRDAVTRIEMGSNETIKQACMAGLGLAFISGHTVSAELESGRLAVLDIEGLPILRKWYVVRRTDKAQTPAAKAFADFLAADGALFLPGLGLGSTLIEPPEPSGEIMR